MRPSSPFAVFKLQSLLFTGILASSRQRNNRRKLHSCIEFTMLEGKAIIDETDMLQTMQQDALKLAAKALDYYDVTEAIEIACFIKKEFDRTYRPGWQCIVGSDFGSFVTHCCGCFIYFNIGSLAILLFKGSTGPEPAEPDQLASLEAIKA
ncbi:hypothetical protein Ancab_016538 [Ancistrocladus abbreviatus]